MSTVSFGPPAQPAATRPASSFGLARGVALVQALYYLATGLWPLIHLDSFLAVTGPKTDLWLVRTVGVLVAVIGAALAVSAVRRLSPEVVTLAVGSAVGLTAIDLIYVSLRVIPPVYLLDAVGEIALLAGWAVAGGRAGPSRVRLGAPVASGLQHR